MAGVTVNYYEDEGNLRRMFGKIPAGKFRVLITGEGGEEDKVNDYSDQEEALKAAKKIGRSVAVYNNSGECLFHA